jgi:hypothetical protein
MEPTMGFNTACLILNDQLHSLAKMPDLGRNIELSVVTAERGHPERQHHTSGFKPLPSCHADTVQIVAVGGNRIFELGCGHWQDEPEALLRKLADQMGFRIVRKAKVPAIPSPGAP